MTKMTIKTDDFAFVQNITPPVGARPEDRPFRLFGRTWFVVGIDWVRYPDSGGVGTVELTRLEEIKSNG